MQPNAVARSTPVATSWAPWMKLWEISVSAPMVIGYRLAGMAPVGSRPNARQRRESARMGQEKMDAWYEASLAAGQRIFEANLAVTSLLWRQVMAGALSPAALVAPWAGLGPSLFSGSVGPVHRRVVANRRRLSRLA